jgi:hypothetical protein
MQCKAQSRRSGQQCRNPAMRGLAVCCMHGGKTPRGPASVHYKSGRFSRFLPTRLFAAYQAAAHDPELRSLRHSIAVVDARIIDILQRVDTGEAGSIWRDAQAAMAKFHLEQAKQNIDGMQLAIAQVDRLITKGAADDAAWGEIEELIEQRRRLCESEQRRLTLASEVLTAESAMLLLGQVVAVMKTPVPDRRVLTEIALDLQALGPRHGNGHVPHDEDAGRMRHP